MSSTNRNSRGEASRRKILNVTAELVSRYGYDTTTISKIVKETGLPASSIYWMFKNKDELITTALENSYTAAPAPSASGTPRWHDYIPELPLDEQLFTELVPALRTTPSETPLRVGIMLALEGAASQSEVQRPFRRRRDAAQVRIEQWWRQVISDDTSEMAKNNAARLSLLTMAFLDGHYVSDLEAEDHMVESRAHLLVNILQHSFLHHSSACTHELPGYPPPTEQSPRAAEEESDPTSQALMDATRTLIAQRGYEGATIARICTQSGVRKSSLYWRYKDKDTLVHAAVTKPFLNLILHRPALLDNDASWIEAISTELEIFTHRICEHPDTVKAGLLLLLQHWDSPNCAGAQTVAGARKIEADTATWLQKHSDLHPELSEHVAWMLMRLKEGVMLDLVLWQQELGLSKRGCLQNILISALSHWEEQLQAVTPPAG
ncbi:TetR/AcrR family transcriptional regulator [Corynebacterium glutamicum]|uniref:TetR/AcrR family transcriptional regulator n=1 Tax=Corynebacterium glutamicum TaxID=1718 RepID=UPI0007449819|nr:TetR/AcrR family transcriptional regulator [Corynebacterium glutamicum]ALZ99014.1 hypothetical protein APT58_01515 [Corynebacterium glutamicum]